MRRDMDVRHARVDLFAKANATRSEAALGLDSRNPQKPLNPKDLARCCIRRGGPWWANAFASGRWMSSRALDPLQGASTGCRSCRKWTRFCGQPARVYRSVDKIYDYGGAKNLRGMGTPCFSQTSVRRGSRHDGCEAKMLSDLENGLAHEGQTSQRSTNQRTLSVCVDRILCSSARSDGSLARRPPTGSTEFQHGGTIQVPVHAARRRHLADVDAVIRVKNVRALARGQRNDHGIRNCAADTLVQ